MNVGQSAETCEPTCREIELSIVMPCLNEAKTVGICIDKAASYLERSTVRGEILVADNGSTDDTRTIVAEKNARIVSVPERGYGAAVRAGIAAARGRYVVMGDADDTYDFSQLDDFVNQLRKGFDLVIGNRFAGEIEPGAMPFLHRYLGNPVLSFMGRLFFRVAIGDFHCGLRAFNRSRIIALNLHTTGMEFASEMIISAALQNYLVTEVPTTLKRDSRSRPPNLRTWRDGWRHLRFLLMFSPRWLFIYPGIALIVIGLLTTVLLFPGPVILSDGVALDIHTFIVAAFSVFIGIQSIGFGIVARRFASRYELLPAAKPLASFLSRLTLENQLIVAGVIAVIGVAGIFWSLLKWASVDFGPLQYPIVMRVLVLSLACIASAFQLAFIGFLSSIMDLPIARDRAKLSDDDELVS